MSRSTLSIKISISELVEELNDVGCVNVLRLLQNELGVNTLNTLVNQIMIQFTRSLTNESLIKIEKTIIDTYSSYSTDKATSATQRNNKNNNTTAIDNVLFPLWRLPSDIISKTALFLNETDIFQFEKCCRLFYKMINNTSYLTQCNNFKRFIITKRRLYQMRQHEYSFFKYSKAKQLKSKLSPFDYRAAGDLYNTETSLGAALEDFETTMNKMQKMASNDNWWTSLCKSISILDLGYDTEVAALLSLMPIDILFNPVPNESNLNTIELSHYAPSRERNTWNNCMNKFEEKYLECKKKCEKQGLKIKSLKLIKHVKGCFSPTVNPRYIESKHVWMNGIQVNLTQDKFLTCECNPGMKMLTIERNVDFTRADNDHDDKLINRDLKIETMRLLQHWNWPQSDICNNKVIIETLNLQNSLKNLTVEFIVSIGDEYDEQQKACDNIFCKKYYCCLENVNIILELGDYTSIDWFFKLLKDNQKILKYQFKQLNIAIVRNLEYATLYFVFKWNKRMDDKSLNQLKMQFDEMKNDENQKQFQEKYLLLRTQWLD